MADRKSPLVFSFILLLSFALLISMGDSKMTLSNRVPTVPTLVCDKIYGTQPGDTCFSIIEAFKLTTAAFTAFNPNLNCDKVFAGEWLCLDAITI
ncbi:hypothetical protein R6Q59_020427 [Mikania micrantha]